MLVVYFDLIFQYVIEDLMFSQFLSYSSNFSMLLFINLAASTTLFPILQLMLIKNIFGINEENENCL